MDVTRSKGIRISRFPNNILCTSVDNTLVFYTMCVTPVWERLLLSFGSNDNRYNLLKNIAWLLHLIGDGAQADTCAYNHRYYLHTEKGGPSSSSLQTPLDSKHLHFIPAVVLPAHMKGQCSNPGLGCQCLGFCSVVANWCWSFRCSTR